MKKQSPDKMIFLFELYDYIIKIAVLAQRVWVSKAIDFLKLMGVAVGGASVTQRCWLAGCCSR